MATERVTQVFSVILVGVIASMLFTFFACGGDDDDDSGDDDMDSGACQAIADNLQTCGFEAQNESWDCFLSWCEGAGYDVIGAKSIYDFPADCLSGSCDDVYDSLYNSSSDLYDAYCEQLLQMQYTGECTGVSPYDTAL